MTMKDTRIPNPATSIQHGSRNPSQNNQSGERNKRSPKPKGKKQSVFVNNTVLYVLYTYMHTHTSLEFINEFTKVSGYKNQHRKTNYISIHL